MPNPNLEKMKLFDRFFQIMVLVLLALYGGAVAAAEGILVIGVFRFLRMLGLQLYLNN